MSQQGTGGVQTSKVSVTAGKPVTAVQQQTVLNQKQVLQRAGSQPLVITNLGEPNNTESCLVSLYITIQRACYN